MYKITKWYRGKGGDIKIALLVTFLFSLLIEMALIKKCEYIVYKTT